MKISSKLLMICLFCALCLIGFRASLHALDMTFHVPVDLSNLPSTITEGTVICSAHPANRATNAVYTASLLGSGQTTFSIAGKYNATVNVVIRNQVSNPAAIGWSCRLFLRDLAHTDERQGKGDPDAGTVLSKYGVDTSKPVKYVSSGII